MDTDEKPGGKGGEISPNLSTDQTSDTRLIEKAIRGRWPIPEHLRAKLPEVLGQIVSSRQSSHRNRIAAARALLSADALNLEQEKRDHGGEQINLNLSGEVAITPAEVIEAGKELEGVLRRRHTQAAPVTNSNGHVHTNGTNGIGGSNGNGRHSA